MKIMKLRKRKDKKSELGHKDTFGYITRNTFGRFLEKASVLELFTPDDKAFHYVLPKE